MMNGDRWHPPAITVCMVCTKLNECNKNKSTVCCTEKIENDSYVDLNPVLHVGDWCC